MEFYQMQAELFAARKTKEDTKNGKRPAKSTAKPKTIYIVAAWFNEGYWKIWRESNMHEFSTVEAAEQFAEKRLKPSMWSNVQIVKLDLPGVNDGPA